MDAPSNNTSAAASRASTPAALSTTTSTDRRKSGAYDSAPSQGHWESDKEREHQGFLKKLFSNKLAPSFLK
jgi:hypothetical protein